MTEIIKLFRTLMHDIVIFLIPKGFRKSLMPSCQQVSEMLEAERLGLSKTIKLKMHLFICQCCVEYRSQMSIISTQAKKLGSVELTDEQKQKIQLSKSNILKEIRAKK